LFKNQIISGIYSKMPFLVWSAAPFIEIMPKASTRQGLLFLRYNNCKLNRSVNTENAERQTNANASEGEVHKFFQRVNTNPNPK